MDIDSVRKNKQVVWSRRDLVSFHFLSYLKEHVSLMLTISVLKWIKVAKFAVKTETDE